MPHKNRYSLLILIHVIKGHGKTAGFIQNHTHKSYESSLDGYLNRYKFKAVSREYMFPFASLDKEILIGQHILMSKLQYLRKVTVVCSRECPKQSPRSTCLSLNSSMSAKDLIWQTSA